MTDDLDTLSDAALSEVFAVEVAGYTDDPHFPQLFWLDAERNAVAKTDDDDGAPVDFFATSADAVLAYLPGDAWCEWQTPPRVCLWIGDGKGQETRASAIAPTFARAACIALIRAKRAEKRQQSPGLTFNQAREILGQ